MTAKLLHQFTEGIYSGDAVSDHAFLLQKWLHEMGFESNIYALKIDPELKERVLPVETYQHSQKERFVLYHHAVGSEIAELLQKLKLPQILVYHNITPAKFYENSDPVLGIQLRKGREQLEQMRDRTVLALAVSHYNELELQSLGYRNTGVLPITLDQSQYDITTNEELASQFSRAQPTMLFVGRVAPNKKIEDLIELLYYYRRLEPETKLILVGSVKNEVYVNWLTELAKSLGLRDDAVIFTGHVSQKDMITYYRSADLFVSMSEHEGFGKPLIESMYLDLPVLAYASSAVPSTLGKAGILFHDKNHESLAELVDLIIKDKTLRQRVIERQQKRVQDFLEPNVKQLWSFYVDMSNL
ncbi:MAG: glycosyltransferase family 4 protein [Candidatus Promineifilaceae bacterium]|nr:glycosyltransferase family 4 protein [Candidatus Promineifilaceae bacterium]